MTTTVLPSIGDGVLAVPIYSLGGMFHEVDSYGQKSLINLAQNASYDFALRFLHVSIAATQ